MPSSKQQSEQERILIIGAGSKVAEAIVRTLAISPIKYSLQQITSGVSKNSHPDGKTVFRCDVTNRKEIKDFCLNAQPTIIINTAAYTSVDKAEEERQTAWQVNVSAVENLVAVCRLTDAHLIHFSTDYVFDGTHGPYTETDKPNPLGYYAKTKMAGENVCIGGSINHTIIRTNVLYGATQALKHDFVVWTLGKLSEGKPFSVVNDQFSNPTLIDDIGYLIEKILRKKTQGIFHAGGADWLSRFDFARKIAQVFREKEELIQPITTTDLHQAAPRPMRGGVIPYKAETMFGMKFSGIESGLVTMKRQLQVTGHHQWTL
ncbi:MAG: dTDP-4-dehydrorhamnose reductase [Candidatus Kapabacteria bacterium]|jgi:dTDP-4-dehydrorhamnose reductase|nr:dTDP-4-dehydrorhamnose reductase [Candidatus Kapabacteria bacterium]